MKITKILAVIAIGLSTNLFADTIVDTGTPLGLNGGWALNNTMDSRYI